jgi:nitrous oxidase accessory protein NosD
MRRKLAAMLIGIAMSQSLSAQNESGVLDMTPKVQGELNAISSLTLQSTVNLPASVDNSTLTYWRGIVGQGFEMSCASVSEIEYVFTYEINRLRNLSSNIPDNLYPEDYTYDFLNGGGNNGTYPTNAFRIVKENGCPNETTWGEHGVDFTKWMTGYQNYYNSMSNTMLDYYSINNIGTPDGLELLKHWFNDHNNDEATGGIAAFALRHRDWDDTGILPPQSYDAGKKVLISIPGTPGGGHAMTFVGYNDNVKYDFNGDGQFTNTIDINSDGVVDMLDWEIGALKIANSWGGNYANSGFIYLPYKFLAQSNIWSWGNCAWVIDAKETHSPLLTAKVQFTHGRRGSIKLRIGFAEDPQATTPDYTYAPSFMQKRGGDIPQNTTLEIGFDLTKCAKENISIGKFFLEIEEIDPSSLYTGVIESFSIIDYSTGSPVEHICPDNNVSILNNTTTRISVDYQYSLSEITEPDLNWSGKQLTLYRDLNIAEDAKLTLTNTTLNFKDDAGLIIKRGGRMDIETGSTLKSYDSGSFWKGIQVWGTPSADQIPFTGGDQGYLYINGESTIENAEIGVLASRRYSNGSISTEYAGGIAIILNGVSFINNKTAVKIIGYPNYNNYSLIRSSYFQTTSNYITGEYPSEFIYLDDVQGVDILGNTFENQVPQNFAYYRRGYGIKAYDAGFSVEEYNSLSNTFEDLYYGIYAVSTGTMPSIVINNNEFNTNYRGVYLNRIDNAIITKNTFQVDNQGLSAYYCTGYTIEENTFTADIQGTGTGIYIYNSGASPNEIYKNTISNLDFGCRASGTNKGDNYGLQFICNTFENNNEHLRVYSLGISETQGNYQMPAGNTFAPNCTGGATNELNNYGNWISGYYFFDDMYGLQEPLCNYRVTLREVSGIENGCLSHLGGGGGTEETKGLLADEQIEINQTSTQISYLEDGGNTDELEQQVISSMPSEMWQLRNELLNKSPFLSDTVMASTVSVENTLPPVVVKEILVANPHSATSDKVWNSIENRNNPLPDYMLYEIQQGEGILSVMEILKSTLSVKSNNKDRLLNSLINYYQNDTLVSSSDSLIALLLNDNTLYSRYKLIT